MDFLKLIRLNYKIRPHCWKERHKISKLATFESDSTQWSEDIHVAPQVAKIHRRLCGGRKKSLYSVKFRDYIDCAS